jgi:hypothetical protein
MKGVGARQTGIDIGLRTKMDLKPEPEETFVQKVIQGGPLPRLSLSAISTLVRYVEVAFDGSSDNSSCNNSKQIQPLLLPKRLLWRKLMPPAAFSVPRFGRRSGLAGGGGGLLWASHPLFCVIIIIICTYCFVSIYS